MDNPARLPCLHYFCWSCITHNIRPRGEVFCPVCRGKTNRREIQADLKMEKISKLYGQLEAALGKPMLLSQLPDPVEPPPPLPPAAVAALDLDPTAVAPSRPLVQQARRGSGPACKAKAKAAGDESATAAAPLFQSRRVSTRRRSQPGGTAGAAIVVAAAATPTPSPVKAAGNGCTTAAVATGTGLQSAVARAVTAEAGERATSAALDAAASTDALREVSNTAASGGEAAQRRICGSGDIAGGGDGSAAPAAGGTCGMKRRRLRSAGTCRAAALEATVVAPPHMAAAAATGPAAAAGTA
ncbi:hypothetical protein Vafri_1812, partial [Volvox africanus]